MPYFDVDDILAEQEKIAVVFRVKGNELGFLEDNSNKADIDVGTSLEMPFFMAKVLAERNMVQITLPRFFHKTFLTSHLAGPVSTDLVKFCDYFYDLGKKFAIISGSSAIREAIHASFTVRYREIVDRAQHKSNDISISDFYSKLTLLERRLFDSKKASVSSFIKWKLRKMESIAVSNIVSSIHTKKRKSKA